MKIKTLGLAAAAALLAATFATQMAPAQPADAGDDDAAIAAAVSAGGPLFDRNCSACHGTSGQGGAGPALAGNDFVSSRTALVTQILLGELDHGMPAFGPILDDEEIAAIATYVRNSWGNAFGLVPADTVARLRASAAGD